MSPLAKTVPAVALLDVGEAVLAELLELALRDADADEVTPPLGTTAGWNAERITWFREFHRASAAGLDGPAGQKSWAISCDGQLAGSVRLKRTETGPGQGGAGCGVGEAAGVGGGALETGIWLARSFRGRGVGREALRQVKARAVSAGAAVLVADTTAGNVGALALLKSAGAELVPGEASQTETETEAASETVKGRIPLP